MPCIHRTMPIGMTRATAAHEANARVGIDSAHPDNAEAAASLAGIITAGDVPSHDAHAMAHARAVIVVGAARVGSWLPPWHAPL